MGTPEERRHFSVEITSKELVRPATPLPELWLPMSNLDLLIPDLHFSMFFVYKRTTMQDFDSFVENIKTSLAKVLMWFYPLAGEVVPNKLCEPEIHCNNRGIDFIGAHADVELENLDYHQPSTSLDGKLLPTLEKGIICIQVTKLLCGGVTLSWTVDHRVFDAYSTNMFMEAWAQVTQTGTTSITPNFRRSLLAPRRPGSPSATDLYVVEPSMALQENGNQSPSNRLTSRIFYMRAKDIDKLQADACSHGAKRSKLEAFSASLWKIVAKTATTDRRNCKMGIVVDGRTRLVDDDNKEATSFSTYFGNVLSIPYSASDPDILTNKPLTWVVDQVHELIRKGTTKEHFLGLIDWVEEIRPKPVMSKIHMRGNEDGPSFVVSNGKIFQAKKLNFGWGAPVYFTASFPWGGDCGYVMPMLTPTGNGDWIIYMLLFKHQLEVVEAEWRDILHPFKLDHLNAC